ncbi:hypothetical protein MPER_12844 [Moniliophthora perniciosa FA553]|nr:hypothetical protein MPER_12844 [Moniliophthora perniciosa FA553]
MRPKVTPGKAFKELLFKEFPDSADTDNGSTDKLYNIVLTVSTFGFGGSGLEKLKKYNRVFLLEVKKLLKPPALLSNHAAVQTYLSAFESAFKLRVQQRMELFVLNQLDKNPGELKHRQDPWQLEDVITQAELVMSTNSGNIYILNSQQSAIGEETQPIIPGMAFSLGIPIPLTNAQLKAAQGQVADTPAKTPTVRHEGGTSSVIPKKEESDPELYNMGVEATVDTHTCTIRAQKQEIDALKQQMATLLTAMSSQKTPSQGTSALAMNQEVRGKHGQPMLGRSAQGASGLTCYSCGENGHMLRDCAIHKQMLNDGWIMWDNQANSYVLKDGKRLPKREPGECWKDKITEYAKLKGWASASEAFYFSGMEEEDETPSVFHAASTGLDEQSIQQIAAALLQQMQMGAAQNDTKN